jgi:hypothetical protein
VVLDLTFLLAGVDGRSAELLRISVGGTVSPELGDSVEGTGVGSTDTCTSERVMDEGTEASAGFTGAVSLAGVDDEVAESALLALCRFFFSPLIDEDTDSDSFGFCFKSYSSLDTRTVFLDAGESVDEAGTSFAVG